MKVIILNIAGLLLGIVLGSVVNMALINVGLMIVPLPEGNNASNMEALRESMSQFGPANFLFPFLAHALGTLVGAFVAAKIAASHKMAFAIGIGCFYLLGGIAAVSMLGGPLWFCVLDLVVAYIPMGYLGGRLAVGRRPSLVEDSAAGDM
jgi:hypothetical protein